MSDLELDAPRTYKFIGEALCLDFCNTGEDRLDGQVGELLGSYFALVAWAVQAHLLSVREADTLRALALEQPGEAANVYNSAVTLRESLYRLFSAVAAQRTPDPADLAALNATLARGAGYRRVIQTETGFAWAWRSAIDGVSDLAQMLWPVAQSSVDLLVSPELARVRECTNGNCSWLFLDLSRNHSRRWCTMEGCGNQMKARRHRQRIARMEPRES